MHIVTLALLMKTEALVRILAGSVVLPGLALARGVSPWWLMLITFVGVNLIQSAFTGFCPPSLALRKLGWVHFNDVIHWGRKVKS